MSWTLTTSGAAIFKAGENADSTATASGAMLAKWSDEVEGRICAECHTDFVADYNNLNTEIKNALSDVASSMIAMRIIAYNMSGYTSRYEAGLMLDLNDTTAADGLKVLKEKQKQRLSS